MWDTFIEYRLYPTYIFELIAAVTGIFYLFTHKAPGKADKLIVFCMILIFVIDFLAITFRLYGYVYDYKYIEYIKETPFQNVFWVYNILTLITGSLFTLYFILQIQSGTWKKLIATGIGVFIVSSIIHFWLGDSFFVTTSSYTYIFGAFLICIAIAAYYLELIRTDRILNFRRELPLYISVGLLLYQLGITPLFIFQRYINVSEDFRIVYGDVLDLANIFMYSVFAFGFIRMIREVKKTKPNALG